MSEDSKIAFLKELPNLQQMCPRLYNYRMMFIPAAAPKTQSELATNTPSKLRVCSGHNWVV
jgi:hypothetical protein